MAARPHSSLRLPELPLLEPAARDFYLRPTRAVARELLGAWFVRLVGARSYGARIVEVEAYLGVRDAAAHSFGGRRTPRVAPMYMTGGHLYVFLVYGMHSCANLVTREEDVPEAVLIRAAEPRGSGGDRQLLSGPGKFCRALGLERYHSGLDLVGSERFLVLPDPVARRRVGVSERVGVEYAGEAASWRLRYFIRDSSAVSK